MFAEERLLRIVDLVNQLGKATVAELSESLAVSSVTIRRDLERLDEKELLIRTHGGAMALHINIAEISQEKSFSEKEEAFAAEKERIAEAASKLVNDGDAVLLTPGTTNMRLARMLIGKKDLTLVTNAANIVTHIGSQSGIDIILTGGKLRNKSYAIVADHSKFGKVTFSQIAPIQVVHTVISDRLLPKEVAQKILDLGIELILC
jgi:DeoR/GlpR family transcriptional regulator of sugar metabolism